MIKKAWENIKTFFKKVYKNEYFRAFCLIYLVGLLCFGIVAFKNYCTIPMGGDYVLQTYAFYSQGYHVFWNFIKTGQYPLFDFTNYLGANYLGTQSFYYVFSPLFYLLCLWPEKLLYQGIFFHMVFKFAVGGFFMYVLLRKYFHVSKKMSWTGGFIYAFSGWALFYLWFHFGDVMAFFPLLIIGIEKCLKERNGWVLSIGAFLCGMSNYFFLVNFCIFGMFYALYRWIYLYGGNNKKGYNTSVRFGVLLQGILFFGIGIAMAGICLLPSLHVATSTNRNQTSANYLVSLLSIFYQAPSKVNGVLTLGDKKPFIEIFQKDNIKELLRILFVWDERSVSSSTKVSSASNVGYILSGWLFMNTNCWDNILFDNVSLDNSIGGLFITTPLTMMLIPSIVKHVKAKRPWTIFGIIMCLALPFFPITAHSAFAFTSLYGRWQLWIVLIGIIFIIPTIDKFELVNRRWVTVNLILNFAVAALVYFISKKAGHLPTGDTVKIFGTKVPEMILIMMIELAVMLVVWFIYRMKFIKPYLVKRLMILIIVAEIGASTVITCENKGYFKWKEYYLAQPQYQELTSLVSDLKKEDTSFYRVLNTEATRSIMNMPSALNYNGASCFNSTYDFALDDFKNRSRMAYSGGWTMGDHEKRYWLDQYIGTKYYIIDKKDPNNDNGSYYKDVSGPFNGKFQSIDEEEKAYSLNLGWNYQLYKEYENYDVYINTEYIGIGYTVENIIESSTAGTGKVASYYEDLYVDTAIIKNDDVSELEEQISDINLKTKHDVSYVKYSFSNWDLFFSPREDMSYYYEKNYERHIYPIEGTQFNKEEISSHMSPSSQFMHKRWEEKGRFGDQLIMQTKEGKQKLASEATSDNPCFICLSFKLGPKVLISFYNGDTLVTQDAHSVSNSSLNAYSSEWKLQRGFYLNQPVDKIVIEYVADTTYSKAFNSSGKLPDVDIYCSYKSDIQAKQDVINSNLLENVQYSNNKFKFTTNKGSAKLAVTNIPYDAGWKLKANGNQIKIYNVNGGFVGFVTPIGETQYELSYFTPLLKEGILLSGVGLLVFIALCYVYRNKKVAILSIETQIEDVYYNQQQIEENQINEKISLKWKQIKNKIRKIFKRKEK